MIKLVFALFMICWLGNAHAQQADQVVTKMITEKDSLFWVAYNNCHLDVAAKFLATDLKFYHDKGGMTSGLINFKNRLKKNICDDPGYRVQRAIVPGSFKVFLLKQKARIYGAISSCDQYFYHFEKEKPASNDDDIAKFMAFWLFKNGEWKMKEIFSYSHENLH